MGKGSGDQEAQNLEKLYSKKSWLQLIYQGVKPKRSWQLVENSVSIMHPMAWQRTDDDGWYASLFWDHSPALNLLAAGSTLG